MKKLFLLCLFILSTIAILSSFDLPTGWFKDGGNPDKYDMGIDKGAGQDGKDAGTIKSIKNDAGLMGTLMQECKADPYKGKRVRMSGYLKTKNVKEMACFWFRVDGKGGHNVLAFDNMIGRGIKGTTDWAKCEIVLDVPDSAASMSFGGMLFGNGQIWFGNIKFEVVDATVASTNTRTGKKEGNDEEEQLLPAPTNLDFKK